jgi:hypothetical protein
MNRYFNKVSAMEAKLGITNSILKISTTKIPVTKPPMSKKRKTKEHQQEHQQVLINTNLPAGVPVGRHGEVIEVPEHGMFYETFNAGTKFYRAADLNLTDSRMLIDLYGICNSVSGSGNLYLAELMLQEINKRKKEEIIKQFLLGELAVKPRND